MAGKIVNYSSVKISFDDGVGSQLTVKIETDKLCMRSISDTKEELAWYVDLFESREIDREAVAKKVRSLVDRWKRGTPYSGFSVFLKKNSTFVGHALLDIELNAPIGAAELSIAVAPRHRGQGYLAEIAHVMTHEYALELMKRGFVYKDRKIERIIAMAFSGSVADSVLEKVGMCLENTEKNEGEEINHYAIQL